MFLSPKINIKLFSPVKFQPCTAVALSIITAMTGFSQDIYTFFIPTTIQWNNEQVSFSLKGESYRLIVHHYHHWWWWCCYNYTKSRSRRRYELCPSTPKKEEKTLVCHSLILSFTLTFELNEYAFPSRLYSKTRFLYFTARVYIGILQQGNHLILIIDISAAKC